MDGSRTFTDEETGDLIIKDEEVESDATEVTYHFENLITTVVPKNITDTLSSTITELVTWDESGRQEWEKLLADNTKLLGLGKESEPDDHEYENSDTSDNPLLLTALTRFQSKALAAMLPLPDRVCQTESALDLEAIEDEDQRDAAQDGVDAAGRRVEKYFADYLLKKHRTYKADTDRILYEMGLHGMGIRKVYNDMSRSTNRTRVEQVDIADLIMSYDAKSMTCGRITHRIDMKTPELVRNIVNGTYQATSTIGSASVEEEGSLEREDNRIHGISEKLARTGESHRIYEIYTELFLESDPHPKGLARPYVITVHAASQEILSLRRNWQEGDEDEQPIETFVAYTYHPGKSAVLGIGLGHILANITRALRTAQRRGLEAGYLQNHPSGYKMSSMKVRDGSSKVRPGEFVDVDTPVGDIRQALMLHPFNGPSQGLIALADKLENNGRELGGVATIDFSQMLKSGVSASAAMAAYDESTEFQTAVHSRLYTGHSTELNLIMDRQREVHGSKPVPFGVNSSLHEGDLIAVNLTPIMQPGQISKQRKILESLAIVEVAEKFPEIVDQRKAVEDYVKALGKSNAISYLLPDPVDAPPPVPADPLSEYAMVLQEQPIKAGVEQNHQAHIDAHAAQMKVIEVSRLPVDKGEAAMAVLAAHIAEHMGQQMLVEVSSSIGIPLEQLAQMPPEMANKIAPVIAQQIQAIEEERRPAEAVQESKVQIEQVKGQNAQALKDMDGRQKKELADLNAKHALELQSAKDDAAMDRAVQDDETAIELAGQKAKAGTISS